MEDLQFRSWDPTGHSVQLEHLCGAVSLQFEEMYDPVLHSPQFWHGVVSASAQQTFSVHRPFAQYEHALQPSSHHTEPAASESLNFPASHARHVPGLESYNLNSNVPLLPQLTRYSPFLHPTHRSHFARLGGMVVRSQAVLLNEPHGQLSQPRHGKGISDFLKRMPSPHGIAGTSSGLGGY